MAAVRHFLRLCKAPKVNTLVQEGSLALKVNLVRCSLGLGAGLGSMNTVGASSSGVQTPFSNSGQLRREDLDGLISQDSPGENGGHKLMRILLGAAGEESSRRKTAKVTMIVVQGGAPQVGVARNGQR